jgi:hypothetical protein
MLKLIRTFNLLSEILDDGKISREEMHQIIDYIYDLKKSRK